MFQAIKKFFISSKKYDQDREIMQQDYICNKTQSISTTHSSSYKQQFNIEDHPIFSSVLNTWTDDVAYACIKMKLVDPNPASIELLEHPNIRQNRFTLIKEIEKFRKLDGMVYLELLENKDNTILIAHRKNIVSFQGNDYFINSQKGAGYIVNIGVEPIGICTTLRQTFILYEQAIQQLEKYAKPPANIFCADKNSAYYNENIIPHEEYKIGNNTITSWNINNIINTMTAGICSVESLISIIGMCNATIVYTIAGNTNKKFNLPYIQYHTQAFVSDQDIYKSSIKLYSEELMRCINNLFCIAGYKPLIIYEN